MARKQQDIPIVLSLLILAVCLGLGGWFVWSYFRSPGDKVVAVIETPQPATRPQRPERAQRRTPRPRATNQQPRPFNEGIRRESRTRWLVRADNVLVRVDLPSEGEPKLDYWMVNILSDPQRDAATAREAILDDRSLAKPLGLSAEQLTSLRKVSLTGNLKLTAGDLRVLDATPEVVKQLQLVTITSRVPLEAAEEQALGKGVADYVRAAGREARVAAEQAVVASVRDIAARHQADIQKSQEEQLAILTSILTPQRTEQFKAIAAKNEQAPATAPSSPSTRPAAAPTTAPSPS